MTGGLPFGAVVGQDAARLALLLGAVDPGLGGVLLTGEKGTAKTTLVRGLAGILPGITVVTGCRFSCDPAAPDPGCPDGPHPAGSGVLSGRPGSGAASQEPVGRDRELAELAEAWAKAAAGEPGVVLIVGEAGIGKTRLAEALAAEAASAGAMVLPARCYETERSLFLQPVVEALLPAVTRRPAAELRRLSPRWCRRPRRCSDRCRPNGFLSTCNGAGRSWPCWASCAGLRHVTRCWSCWTIFSMRASRPSNSCTTLAGTRAAAGCS